MTTQEDFELLPPECDATVNVTTFRYRGTTYTVSTTDIRPFHAMQIIYDQRHGYTGPLGNYETLLFINHKSEQGVYPFAGLPGCPGLGVFVRYETEDEARDGHQTFLTRVQRVLRERGKS